MPSSSPTRPPSSAPDARGAVIVTGSHGGRYAAYLTLKAHPRAVIHNDAGVGKDEAGIAVIAMAEALGVAAATASHASCRIGDAARHDGARRGQPRQRAGPRTRASPPAWPAATPRLRLIAARAPAIAIPSRAARRGACSSSAGWRRRIVLIDSASLIAPRTRARSSSPARTARSWAAARRWRCGSMASPPSSATPASASTTPASPACPALDAPRHCRHCRLGRLGAHRRRRLASTRTASSRTSTPPRARLGARVGERLKPRLAAWAELGLTGLTAPSARCHRTAARPAPARAARPAAGTSCARRGRP